MQYVHSSQPPIKSHPPRFTRLLSPLRPSLATPWTAGSSSPRAPPRRPPLATPSTAGSSPPRGPPRHSPSSPDVPREEPRPARVPRAAGCASPRAPPRASPSSPESRPARPALRRWSPVQRGQPSVAGFAPSRAPLHGHCSRIPAPRQSSPAGCGPVWSTPIRQTSRSAEPSCSSVQHPSPKCRPSSGDVISIHSSNQLEEIFTAASKLSKLVILYSCEIPGSCLSTNRGVPAWLHCTRYSGQTMSHSRNGVTSNVNTLLVTDVALG